MKKKSVLLMLGVSFFSVLLSVTPSVTLASNGGVAEAAKSTRVYFDKKIAKGKSPAETYQATFNINGKNQIKTVYLMSWDKKTRVARYFYYV